MICPICLRTGAPGPVGPTGARESMACDGCGATSRWRSIRLAVQCLQVEAALFGGREVLRAYSVGWPQVDVFCAVRSGRVDLTISERAPVAGAVVQDLEALTFPDGAFDLVLCADVLEHVRMYGPALREIVRVLSPYGAAVITCPLVGGNYHQEFCALGANSDTDRWSDDAPVHADPRDAGGCRVFRYYAWPRLRQELAALGLSAVVTPPDVAAYGVVASPVIIARRSP